MGYLVPIRSMKEQVASSLSHEVVGVIEDITDIVRHDGR